MLEYNEKNAMPLVSIGIPVFNGEKYLASALEGLLVQSYTNIEIIISDNHSGDLTASICNEFSKKDNRIRYYRQQITLNAADNFYYVLEMSTGSYFMWASYDDFRDKDYIFNLTQALERNIQNVCAFTRFQDINESGKSIAPSVNLDYSSSLGLLRLIKYWMYIPNYRDVCVYGIYRAKAIRNLPRDQFFWSNGKSPKRMANIIMTGILASGGYVFVKDSIFLRRVVKDKPRDVLAQKKTSYLQREYDYILRELEVRYISFVIVYKISKSALISCAILPFMLISFLLVLLRRYWTTVANKWVTYVRK
jgi:glycosyltransferase involved in cell wall biosynthesis